MSGRKGKDDVADAIGGAAPAAPPPPAHLARVLRNFIADGAGIWRRGDAGPDGEQRRDWVSDPVELLTETRDADGKNWGLLLRWRDRDGRQHEEIVPREWLDAEGTTLRAMLAAGGLTLSPRPEAKKNLVAYLSALCGQRRATVVETGGWHDIAGRRVFMLGGNALGVPGGAVLLAPAARDDGVFQQAGTLESWRGAVAARAIGNSRLVLAISAAFAAPLLHLLGEDGFGVHFQGKSRAGKTTLLRAAASAAGGSVAQGAAGFVRAWRATGNGLESVAGQHCDCLLTLDEIGQVDERELGGIADMLANGQGKARATRQGTARAPLRWRTLFLSTGEISLAQAITEGRRTVRAGMAVRMLDIPAEPRRGSGAFEVWSIDGGAAELARALAEAARQNFGTALPVFLAKLLAELGQDAEGYVKAADVGRLAEQWAPAGCDAQVRSVARRLALIAVAGEEASEWEITGWPRGEATRAAKICFDDWLRERGGAGAAEDMQAVAQFRAFISTHGSARFTDWIPAREREAMNHDEIATDRPTDTLSPERMRILNRAGWRRKDPAPHGGEVWTYFLTAEGMRDALTGLSFRDAVTVLLREGLLVPAGTKPSKPYSVPGWGSVRLYQVAPDVLADADQYG